MQAPPGKKIKKLFRFKEAAMLALVLLFDKIQFLSVSLLSKNYWKF